MRISTQNEFRRKCRSATGRLELYAEQFDGAEDQSQSCVGGECVMHPRVPSLGKEIEAEESGVLMNHRCAMLAAESEDQLSPGRCEARRSA